jgi:hypothetical protein
MLDRLLPAFLCVASAAALAGCCGSSTDYETTKSDVSADIALGDLDTEQRLAVSDEQGDGGVTFFGEDGRTVEIVLSGHDEDSRPLTVQLDAKASLGGMKVLHGDGAELCVELGCTPDHPYCHDDYKDCFAPDGVIFARSPSGDYCEGGACEDAVVFDVYLSPTPGSPVSGWIHATVGYAKRSHTDSCFGGDFGNVAG